MAAKRKPVTREKVLEAAFEVVQREGLEALSMRRVGEAVGVEAMSLYNHVDGKAALLDGLFEGVLAKPPPPPTRKAGSWQAAVRERATSLRAVLLAHPRFLPLFASRPAVTPASIAHVEFVLQVLADAGFSPGDALKALEAVVAFVVGHALSSAASVPTAEAPRPRYELLDPALFPRVRHMARLLDGHSGDDEFRFGLDCFLDGLTTRCPQKAESPRARRA